MNYVIVLGAGKSGYAVCSVLAKHGTLPVLFDDKYITPLNQCKYIDKAEYIVVSPGIGDTHSVVKYAKAIGKEILGEIEFAYRFSIGNYKNIIGVTGTNGKTTVVSMLGHILSDVAIVAGNIGNAWSNEIEKKNDICVLELSSFQLATIKNFHSNIACVLNLAPDHIDYHGSLKNYYNAKMNLLKNLNENDCCILNSEDKNLLRMAETRANIIMFGFDNISDGCFVKDGTIYYRENGIDKFVVDILMVGNDLRHNIMNVMAVVCVLEKCEDNIYSKLYRLLSYEYYPFRMSNCGTVRGMCVYNDSKSTNVASTVIALKALAKYNKIALILGGRYKNEKFDKIFTFKNISKIYIFGESKDIIYQNAKKCGFNNVIKGSTLDELVKSIFSANEYDCVLFSPACASFDMYSGYEERGKHFNTLLKNVVNES